MKLDLIANSGNDENYTPPAKSERPEEILDRILKKTGVVPLSPPDKEDWEESIRLAKRLSEYSHSGFEISFDPEYLIEKINRIFATERASLVEKIEGLDKWGSADFGGMLTKEDGGWIKLDDLLTLLKDINGR